MKKIPLSKLGKENLDNFFMSKMLALEEDGSKGVFSRQIGLQTLQNEVEVFIKLHPKSQFELVARDVETGQPSILVLINCSEEEVRNHYKIEINLAWTGCITTQSSESGKYSIRVDTFELE